MVKELNHYILTNFNEGDINHAYAILLRTNYELDCMKYKKCDFTLDQMSHFTIEYHNTIKVIVFEHVFLLTEEELHDYVENIYTYFHEKYSIHYDLKKINPIYFSLFFYDLLPKIISVKEDTINLGDILLLRYKKSPVKLEESERYKALVNQNYKMYSPFPSNLVIETPEERLLNIYQSIKENGYGYGEQYAIFYNDEPYIRDGQHRASVLKYLYGDIDIKIIRFYLIDNYFYE